MRRRDTRESPNELCHQISLHLWSNRVYIHTLPAQKGPRIFDVVDAGRLDVDILKASLRELGDVLIIIERPGDASDPQQHILPDVRRYFAPCDNIGNGETA